MGLKCGIVGLPNVGKSTLFNLLTDSEVDAANYPFCTIEANVGIAPLHDAKLQEIAEIAKARKIVPTVLEFVDIAGLIRGASKGEGLGNQFLEHVRNVDALVHVVRCFDSEEIVHVDGSVDPVRDLLTIRDEFLLADLAVTERNLAKNQKIARGGDRIAREKAELLARLCDTLSEGVRPDTMALSKEGNSLVREMGLLSLKPELLVANVQENQVYSQPYLQALTGYLDGHDTTMLPISVQLESELRTLSRAEKMDFFSESGHTSGGLERIVDAAYRLLDLLTFYTAGEKEARAWTIPKGMTAQYAAGRIHSDFEKSFIRAEVVSYPDFTGCRGTADARRAGKARMEGKHYVVQEGDVVYFHCS